MLKSMRKYLLAVTAGSVIFGCGAHVNVDVGQKVSVAMIKNNLQKGGG